METELLEDIVPGSGAFSQMRKVRMDEKAKTKPGTPATPNLKTVYAKYLWNGPGSRSGRRPRHLGKVSGCGLL